MKRTDKLGDTSPGIPGWIDLGSPDPEASRRFYSELFGWEVTERAPASVNGGNPSGFGLFENRSDFINAFWPGGVPGKTQPTGLPSSRNVTSAANPLTTYRLAAYDNGVRFLQVTPEGKIVEQGYFQPLGFETSSAKWVPGTNIVYSIDCLRGIDILKWNGDHYVPDANGIVHPEKGKIAGTHGVEPVLPKLTAKQQAFAVREVNLLHAQGWFAGYCQLAAERDQAAS